MFFDNINIHPSWRSLIQGQGVALAHIERQIGADCTPPLDITLRFLENDLHKIKIIILGQDPYPQKGAATGLAFEVAGLYSFLCPIKQTSLRNILRAIYKAYTNETASINQIRQAITTGRFNILPPDLLFKSWQAQGVLLLNTTFTCRVNGPNTHITIWKAFSEAVFSFIKDAAPNVIWFLWGKAAKTYQTYTNNVYISCHPMLGLDPTCFYETKHIIDWRGI